MDTIECHTCGGRVSWVRSVKIRGDVGRESKQLVQRYKDPNHIPESAYAQYRRNTDYRRAFICESCYKILDGLSETEQGLVSTGVAEIIGEWGPKTWNLAGVSRGDKAAVYDYAKWLAFQRRKAGEMGIDFS